MSEKEWKDIKGFDGWSNKLRSLLKEAEEIATSEALSKRLDMVQRLTDFVVRSGPNTPEIEALDALANEARKDLTLSTIENRIANIVGRSGELAAVTKKFKRAADDAQAAASAIALEPVQKAVGSLTDTVLSLKALRNALDEKKHKAIISNIGQVLNNLQSLRKDVEGLV